MLRAHSPLWYYLWVAPNVYLTVLAVILFRRGSHRAHPFFFLFAIANALGQLTLYIADVTPSVSAEAWWRIFWADLLLQGLLKFALIGEIFAHVFDAYSSVARLGKFLIRGLGVLLILTAAIAAAFAPQSSLFGIVNGAHLLEEAIYLIEAGLLLFIFAFSAYFHLSPKRPVFGIALGLAISACVHLATWTIIANSAPKAAGTVLDFVNMAAFHVAVLIWAYYLLVPQKVETKIAVLLPENNLAIWNRELERLLQQ